MHGYKYVTIRLRALDFYEVIKVNQVVNYHVVYHLIQIESEYSNSLIVLV